MKSLATKFLDHYTKSDRDIFFGRDTEIRDFTNILQRSRLTLLYGLSGTGKTSLIECGVANEFSEYDWLDVYVRRKFNIIDSLRRAIVNRTSRVIPSEQITSAISLLYNDYFRPVYLIFDQFEELFINGDAAEISAFGDTLAEILKSDVPCRVVLVMREEYFGRLDQFEPKIPSIYESRMRLERMDTIKLKLVIERIAEESDVHLKSPDVLTDILKAVTNDAGVVDLPDLAVYLKKIFDAAIQKKKPNEKVYFDQTLIKENQFADILGKYLSDTVAEVAKELSNSFDKTADPKEFVWAVLKKHFISLDGTKKTFSLYGRS